MANKNIPAQTFFAFEPGQFNKTMRTLENANALSFCGNDEQRAQGSYTNGAFSVKAMVEAMTKQSARVNRTEYTESLLRENGL